MSRFFHAIGHVGWMSINLVVTCALLLSALGTYISPETFVVPSLLGIVFEPLIWVNLLMGISWWFSSHKSWCLVSFVALGICSGNILATYSHEHPQTEDAAHQLTILTYNTHQCGQLKKANQNEVLQFIRESGADIVCLQEYEVSKNTKYLTFEEAKQFLRDTYPYTYYDFCVHNSARQFGLAVYSKYPLIHKTRIEYPSRGNQSNYCDVVVGSDTLRLFNNHLESYSLVELSGPLPDSFESEQFKKTTWTVLKKMIATFPYRARQSEIVHQTIAASPYPVIVAGDMNDVPVSYAYHQMSRGLTDTFLHASVGRNGWTYQRSLAGVRIDYILVSESFGVSAANVIKRTGSDHYPYTATICW